MLDKSNLFVFFFIKNLNVGMRVLYMCDGYNM